jgi:hypothetical protein
LANQFFDQTLYKRAELWKEEPGTERRWSFTASKAVRQSGRANAAKRCCDAGATT